VLKYLIEIYAGRVYDLDRFWKDQITGKTLLDIGIVEHDMELANRAGWRHGLFHKLAARTVGVDILEAEIAKIRERGYDVRVCDATSDADLGERFEVVYIGDVIEHVNDPVRLICFARRHLAPGGRIIVSTPCPFWWRNIQQMVTAHVFIGNVDHVRWVTPVNALEIGYRAAATLIEYRTVETSGSNKFRNILQKIFYNIMGRNELFTWAYIYTFANKE
jgi:2-polyprenyl-3-methyl-5-hydroxy-6-metoxy-1,4-benzoquinol methylase